MSLDGNTKSGDADLLHRLWNQPDFKNQLRVWQGDIITVVPGLRHSLCGAIKIDDRRSTAPTSGAF